MMNRCPGRMETTGRKEVLLRLKQLRGPNPSDATSATVRTVRGGAGLSIRAPGRMRARGPGTEQFRYMLSMEPPSAA